MIISRCPKQTILDTLVALDLRADIEPLSPSGLRHRVKLYPSHIKNLTVPGTERTVYSAPLATRQQLVSIYREIFSHCTYPEQPQPNHLLTLAFRARLQDAVPQAERSIYDIPDTQALIAELGIDLPRLLHAEKIAKLIVGNKRIPTKKIARYQRQSPRSNKAVAAVCWHGFRDFFMKLFELQPKARAKTAYALYDGRDGFYKNYPETAYRNIGSTYAPVEVQDACWCAELERNS